LRASAPSSHDLSLAAFTINIAESNFWHTQVAERQPTGESRRDALVGFVRKLAQSSGTVSDEDLRRPVLQNLHACCSVRCGQSMD
jgi:hypothetical protein